MKEGIRLIKAMDFNRRLTHFQNNQLDRTEPNWSAPTRLTATQINSLLPSLPQFELGDGGGSYYLTAWNRGLLLDFKVVTLS